VSRQDVGMAELTVRLAERGEELAIARVHVGTWQVAYRGIVPDDVLDAMNAESRAASYDADKWMTPDQPAWVAVRDEIVGFAVAGPSRDEDGHGELGAIYVDSNEWGRGTGELLMEAALDFLRPRYPEATLWVLRDNPRARRFYEKHGWTFDGTSKVDERPSFVLHEVRYRIVF
jgi:GNAT superfamily N-acetyltransferase